MLDPAMPTGRGVAPVQPGSSDGSSSLTQTVTEPHPQNKLGQQKASKSRTRQRAYLPHQVIGVSLLLLV
jgi:hypothetical protein